jgi:hypothetical protein
MSCCFENAAARGWRLGARKSGPVEPSLLGSCLLFNAKSHKRCVQHRYVWHRRPGNRHLRNCHPGESRDPTREARGVSGESAAFASWVPAFAGMTAKSIDHRYPITTSHGPRPA